MKRLYYLTRSLDSAEDISETLHHEGVTDWHFHILSKDDAGLVTRRLHSANLFHRLDIVHSMERGIILGGMLGSILVLFLMWSDVGYQASNMVWAALLVFFVLAGAWIGGMAGVNLENYKVRRFHERIDQGFHLLMIDVSRDQVEVVKELMTEQYPEAIWQGLDSTFTNPFRAADGKVHIV